MQFVRSFLLVASVSLAVVAPSAGCGSSDSSAGNGFVTGTFPATVGPSGGVLEATVDSGALGVRLEIPPGALDADTSFDVRRTHDTTPLAAPSMFVGDHFAFTPSAVVFKSPVKLTVPVRPEDVFEGQSTSADCKVWMRDGAAWKQLPQVASSEGTVSVETTALATAAAGLNFRGTIPTFNIPPACTSPSGYCFTKLAGRIDPSASSFASIHDGIVGFLIREDGNLALAEYNVATGDTILGPSNRNAEFPTLGAGGLTYLGNGEYGSIEAQRFFVFPQTAPKRVERFSGTGVTASLNGAPPVTNQPAGWAASKTGAPYALFDSGTRDAPSGPFPSLTYRKGTASDFVNVINFPAFSSKFVAIPGTDDFLFNRGFILGRYLDADRTHPEKFGAPNVATWLSVTTTATKLAASANANDGKTVYLLRPYGGTAFTKTMVSGATKMAIMTDGSAMAAGLGFLLHIKNDESVVSIALREADLPIGVEERYSIKTLQALPNNEALMFVGAQSAASYVIKIRLAP